MTKKRNPWRLVLALSLVSGAPALAQLELSSSTVDGGGGTSTGGTFEVSGTVGQFDAGALSGGSFDLESGFWTSQNPAVPVELQSFEIVSGTPSATAEERSCRQEANPRPGPVPGRLEQPIGPAPRQLYAADP